MAGDASSMNRGKLIIVLMVGAGLAAAGVAVWYQYQLTRRPLALWGTAVAGLINRADRVELHRLSPEAESAGAEKRDISRARGAIHFRRSLLEDGSFDWERDARGVRPQWDYLVRFEGENGWATISFDLDENVAQLTGWNDRLIALSPRTAKGLKTFFAEQFSDDGGK
jgi:hypothetical protein